MTTTSCGLKEAGSASRYELHVLLVEDDPADAALAKRGLAQIPWADVKVTHVATVQAALSFLEHSPPDVVITDLGLEDSQGLTTVRALAASHHIPVLVLSGRDESEVLFEAIEQGADDYVQKDLSRTSLSRALRATVARDRVRKSALVIVNSSADAMVVFDEDGIVRLTNPAAHELFGSRVALSQTFPFASTDMSSTEIELDQDERYRGPRMAEMRTRALEWDGRPCFLAVVRDITDRKRAEEYERQLSHAGRLSAIGQLAAGVAHEINNPAAFISANLEILRERLDALEAATAGAAQASPPEPIPASMRDIWSDARQMLSDCDDGLKRITDTVRDLSSFARIERDELEPLQIGNLIDVAVSMTRNEIRHSARLNLRVADVPPVVGDRGKLSQVFVNLLLNAVHALEHTGTRIDEISVEAYEDGEFVVIAVEDTGRGIPANALQTVFEPFYTTKSRERGTGLGLAISADTVRKHGGHIKVTSEVGRGTRFEVRLPGRPDAVVARPDAEPSPPAKPTTLASMRGRVLLVDDERHLRLALRRLLRDFEVVECKDGNEALELLAVDSAFDVVLSDLMMPGADGIDLYEVLRSSIPGLLDRTIFMTGGAFTPRAKEFIARAERPILEKPLTRKDLTQAIWAILEQT